MKLSPIAVIPFAGLVLALCAAAIVLFVPKKGNQRVPLPRVELTVTREGRERVLKVREPLRAGDSVRFFLDGAGATHFVLLLKDSSGQIRVLHPASGTEAAPIEPPGAIGYRWTVEGAAGPATLLSVFALRPVALSELSSPQAFDDPVLGVAGAVRGPDFPFVIER